MNIRMEWSKVLSQFGKNARQAGQNKQAEEIVFRFIKRAGLISAGRVAKKI